MLILRVNNVNHLSINHMIVISEDSSFQSSIWSFGGIPAFPMVRAFIIGCASGLLGNFYNISFYPAYTTHCLYSKL